MSLDRLGNVGPNWLAVLLMISLLHEGLSTSPKNTASLIESMNPIVRYRFTAHLKNRLQQLDSNSADRQKPNRNSRNCFFSPVQCQLPVEVASQQRPDNLYVVNKFRKRLSSLPFFSASALGLVD
uniref:Secreted protein n=1 Tax=Steinernema glaseri TaxID=37863 RepID=A0A1I7YGA0_9BILA